jgi:hypothetical protein
MPAARRRSLMPDLRRPTFIRGATLRTAADPVLAGKAGLNVPGFVMHGRHKCWTAIAIAMAQIER